MSQATTVKLRHPIEFGSEMIEELAFRRGRLGDLKGVSIANVNLEGLLMVASRLCGQPVAALEKLDEEDAGEVVAIALRFFERSLSAGGTS